MKKITLLLSIAIWGFSCNKKKETTVLFSNENIKSIAQYATEEDAFEGKTAFKILPEQEYGPTWKFTEKELNLNNVDELTFSFRSKNMNATDSSIFVFASYDSSGKELFYEGVIINNPSFKTTKWKLNVANFDVSKPFPENAVHSIYIWNNKRQTVFVDDLEMETK